MLKISFDQGASEVGGRIMYVGCIFRALGTGKLSELSLFKVAEFLPECAFLFEKRLPFIQDGIPGERSRRSSAASLLPRAFLAFQERKGRGTEGKTTLLMPCFAIPETKR